MKYPELFFAHYRNRSFINYLQYKLNKVFSFELNFYTNFLTLNGKLNIYIWCLENVTNRWTHTVQVWFKSCQCDIPHCLSDESSIVFVLALLLEGFFYPLTLLSLRKCSWTMIYIFVYIFFFSRIIAKIGKVYETVWFGVHLIVFVIRFGHESRQCFFFFNL